MEARNIALEDILLDPNNYRVQAQDGFTHIASDRYHLDRVQAGALQKLRRENLGPLRDSIVANGFLPIERIVVSEYAHADGKYVVIEGNRRIAALQQIRDEHESGIDIDERVVETLAAVPCLVAEEAGQDPFFREALMGIRHVGGIKEWGGFQRAKLIADLKDTHDLEAPQIAERLGLNVQEVNRRYRAIKALQQMQEDEGFSEYATASMYPIFHEAVSLPIVRDWLGWSAAETRFLDEPAKETFYQLITPRNPGQDDQRDEKIRTYLEVRQLRDILPNPDARADLFNLEREFVDALSIAQQENRVRRWRNEVGEARNALNNIPGAEIQNFSNEDIQSITLLIDSSNNILEMHRLLTAQNRQDG